MKKSFITKSILFILLMFIFIFAINNSSVNASNEVASIDGTKYTSLNDALNNAKKDETVKLENNVTISEDGTPSEENGHWTDKGYVGLIKKRSEEDPITITLDLNGKTISSDKQNATFFVGNGNTLIITDTSEGIGKIENTVKKQAMLIENGNVILKNGTIESEKYIAIEVGNHEKKDKSSNNSLTIEGGTIKSSEYGYGVVTGTNKSTITMKDGKIEAKLRGIYAYKCDEANISMEGGEIVVDSFDNKDTPSGIQISSITNGIIKMTGGTITGQNGIAGTGDGVKIDVSGGKIDVTSIGINSNNSSKNIDVNISGGNIKGTVGIYKPQDGKLTISDGTIEGDIGVVARQGEVEIKGGTIKATAKSEEKHKIGDMSHELPQGAAVIVDNVSKNYGSDIKVVISGGTFESTYETSLYSYQEDNTDGKDDDELDFDIKSGKFTKPVNQDYIDSSVQEVITNDTVYYVGEKYVEQALEEVKEGDSLDVKQGSLEITDLPDGVSVQNTGEGEVNVDGTTVGTTPVDSTLTNEKKKLQEELNKAKKDGEIAKSEADRLQKELDQAKKDGEITKSELDKLQKELDQSKKDGNTAKGELDELQKELNSVKKELNKIKNTPAQLKGLKVSSQATTSIKLSWKKLSNVTGYKVYKYDYSKKAWEYVGKQKSGTTYTVKGLKAGTIYKFRVRAYKTVDGEQIFGKYATSVKTTTKTSTPKISSVTSKSKKATVKWGKVSGASGYEVYMATSKSGKYTKIKTAGKSTKSYTKSSLKKGKTYYFKVRTYKIVDGKKTYSSYSSIKSVKIK